MAGLFPAPVLESLRASPDRPALEVEERMAVEELLAERGAEVDHVTVFRWVQRITPLLADAARFSRHSPGDRWFIDETYVNVNGVWRYVYRAVDPDRAEVGAYEEPTALVRGVTGPERALPVNPCGR